MRILLTLLCLAAAPASAWTFSPSPVCTLSLDGPVAVTLTHDPRLAEPYAITITGPEAWPQADVFGLSFEGGRALTITTPRHQRSEDGLSLTVTDRGFGNVLTGLEFNQTATAFSGDARRTFALEGAAEPVAAFRACLAAPIA